ncbi:mitochondrial escape protein 2 [Entophlyctis luteolus]|nr:mitochondrial escape protein 2 [Entophlyctis luteolus]
MTMFARRMLHPPRLLPLSPRSLFPRLPQNRAYGAYALVKNVRLASNAPGSVVTKDAQENALAIWFEGVYPIKLAQWDPRHIWARYNADSLKANAKKLILPPQEEFKARFTYLNSVPSIKEGGLLVRFLYEGDKQEAFDTISNFVQKKGIRSFAVGGAKIKAHPVEGSPWIEDLRSSIPSSRFSLYERGPELAVEDLFDEFRQYGKIDSITVQQSAKDAPKYGHIQFLSRRAATSARICMNGKVVGSTKILISYEPVSDEFVNETLPVILAILALLSFLIFDPMRVFFVTNTVTERFSVSKYLGISLLDAFVILKSKFMSLIFGSLPGDKTNTEQESGLDDALDVAMKELKEHEAKLMVFMKETPETVMLVHGPKGTQHMDLIEKCLKNEPYVLRIHLEDIVNQPDHIFLNRLSQQTGCFPMFNWTVSIGNILDTVVTATTGAKANLSSSVETQIRKMFEITTISFNRIVQNQLAKRQAVLSQNRASVADADGKSEGSVSTAPVALPEVEYPIVIIEGFLGNEKARQAQIYGLITEWVNTLSEMQVAQVVFVSDSPAAAKYLSRALPNRTVETIALKDASFTASLAYAQRRLGLLPWQKAPAELEEGVRVLGGRLSDLELLVQKIQAELRAQKQQHNGQENGTKRIVGIVRKIGNSAASVDRDAALSDAARATPSQLADASAKALNDIIVRIESEVRKVGLFDDAIGQGAASSVAAKKEWTTVQMWKIIQLLAKYNEVSYDDLRYHPLFKGDETAIQSIERAGLVTIGLHEGRPYVVKAGRPIHRAVFTRLQADTKYAAIMGLKTVKALMSDETTKLKDCETELSTLTGQISTDILGIWGASDLRKRADFLAKQVGESHEKLAKLDAEERKLKKVVKLLE